MGPCRNLRAKTADLESVLYQYATACIAGLVGMSRWLDGISVHTQNRTFRYRPRTGPEAAGPRRAATSTLHRVLLFGKYQLLLASADENSVQTALKQAKGY
jgi:hypothetical protein